METTRVLEAEGFGEVEGPDGLVSSLPAKAPGPEECDFQPLLSFTWLVAIAVYQAL